VITRRSFLLGAGGLLAAALAGGGYAVAIEPRFRLRVQTWRIEPDGWPAELPLRIIAVADPHLGAPVMPIARWRHIVEVANSLAGDVIVFLGDFIGSHRFVTETYPVEAIAAVAAEAAAPLGRFAILGNHDWWGDHEAQARGGGPTAIGRALAAAGVPVLENDAVRLVHRETAFWLAGLGDQLALRRRGGGFVGVDNLPGTLARVTDTAPVILLAHEPDIFPQVPPRVALTLSGHTHGGQIRLFGYSPVVPSRFGNRYAYGPVVEARRHLVVSGGLGCSIAPVRLGVPPEITVVDLSRPPAAAT
jgi:predicted MPP superfamily phosphohydrolase